MQSFQEIQGDCPLQEEQEPPCSRPHSRRLCRECIIRPSVITSLNLPRTLGLPPPNLPYKFILLKKLKMSVFCEHCINELSPRMTEGGKEEEAREDIPHFECLHVCTLSSPGSEPSQAALCAERGQGHQALLLSPRGHSNQPTWW